MKVILLQDVKGTGKKDQIVEASDGFARNYLIPRKMAREATAEAVNAIQKSKSADKHREDVRRAEAEERSRKLKGKVIQLTVRGGENGKLFGSITSADIAEAVKEQSGADIDKKKIQLDSPIKQVGDFEVPVKLFHEVSAVLKVKTVAE